MSKRTEGRVRSGVLNDLIEKFTNKIGALHEWSREELDDLREWLEILDQTILEELVRRDDSEAEHLYENKIEEDDGEWSEQRDSLYKSHNSRGS